MNEMVIENIKQYCKELKLGSYIVKTLYHRSRQSGRILSPGLGDGSKTPASREKNRYLKQAGFDILKTFADYTFDQIEIPGSIGREELKMLHL